MMIKLLSHSVIALSLILGFAPAVKPITISEADNFYTQTTTIDEEKLATAHKLLGEGLKLFNQRTKESLLQAIDKLEQALPLYQALNQSEAEAITLSLLGRVYDSLGDKQQALDKYNQALTIYRSVGYLSGEANTLNNIGNIYNSLGKQQKALDYLKQALPLRRAVGDRNGEAITLNNIGTVYVLLENNQQALDYYNRALPIFEIVGDRRSKVDILQNIAYINYASENYTTALQNINEAIEIIEEIRSNLVSKDLKASFFSTVQDNYKLKTEILMKLHQQKPNQGYDVLAFETSEQGKARSLLELLTEANIDIRQGVTPELVTEEEQLQNKLDAIEKRRISLCTNDCSQRLLNQLETERRELLEQYKQVKAKIRANSPEYAELTQPEPIKLKQLQRLLDEDTVLWQYSLWRDHSYVWVITKDSFTTHEIASNPEIEPIAREYHKLLQYDSIDKKLNSVATKLSQLITPPIAETKQLS
ncbi:MAG: tetratricopeptide repeat protein [Xenococcaceae cyanobacterium MO_188.B19]|nr:tetratricopeptide repeat protein [Xenococcaceae cyanobacterium MO_188.B19]